MKTNLSAIKHDARPFAFLAIAFVCMCIIRVTFVWPRSFPIHSGGLWYVVAKEILANHFALPASVTFNQAEFALVYPPLAGYLIAALEYLTGQSSLTLILWLPFCLSLLTLPALFLLARSFFDDRLAAGIAVLIYPATFQSFEGFMPGGGVPRGLGLCFQLLAWWAACRSGSAKGLAWPAVAGIFAGGAILSHPSAAFWTVLGIVFLGVLDRRFSHASLLMMGACAVCITAPWAGTVLLRHGLSPFLAAFQTGGEELFSWKLLGTPERLLLPGQLFGSFALIGVCLFARDGRPAMPALLLAGLAFDHRGLFMINGVALGVIAAAQGITCTYRLCVPFTPGNDGLLATRATDALFAGILFLHVLFSNLSFYQKEKLLYTDPTPEDVASFQAVKDAFHGSPRRLLYLRSAKRSPDVAEWFSVVADQRIIELPQGQEWSGRYREATNAKVELDRCCESASWPCVRKVVTKYGLSFDNVAVDTVSCPGLLPSVPKEDARVFRRVLIGNMPSED